MTKRYDFPGLFLSGLSALCVLAACSSSPSGTGTGDQGNSTGGDGFGSGGFPAGSGGFPAGSGGFPTSSGGFPTGSGGFPTSSGGFPTSSGGFPTGTGGDTTSTGGGETGTGGSETGTGGTTGSTGGTTGSTGGTTGSTGGTTSGGPTAGPCLTDASEGTIIGDSYVTGFGTPALQGELAALDATIGMFSNYAVAGVSMATGGLNTNEDVPLQFTAAIAAHPTIKFSIMDGGGNDILLCDTTAYPGCNTVCSQTGSSKNATCQAIVSKAFATAKTLMQSAADAGVKDVVYFFYPHIPSKGGGGGGYSEILDYSEPQAKTLCDSAYANTGNKLSCHFVDTAAPFKAAFATATYPDGADPAQFEITGIHPLKAGVDIIAQQIYNSMKTNCVGLTAADAKTAGCTCTQ